MSLDDPVILTCSISGAVANRDQCPAIPYTPEEYAAEARRIVDEGGSMIHIHARTPDGTPSYEVEDFRAITEAILAEVGDVVINYSTGALGVPVEKRIAYLRELRPDVGALNMGSMNYAKYSRRRKEFVFSFVFENSFDTIRALLDGDERVRDPARARVLRLRPPGQPRPAAGHGRAAPAAAGLVRDGRDGRHPADGAQPRRTWPSRCPDVPHEWGVIGVSRDQWTLVAAALALGGNVRVGLEDNFYLPDGEMARSNGDLIARARRMAEDSGRRVATVAEARQRLGLRERAALA